MGKPSRLIYLLLLFVFLGIQFIDVKHSNPPVKGEIQIPPEIRLILKNSCYDCHSNETIWPWYSKVAPVSWYLIGEVNDGRRKLNFSEWDKYNPSQRDRKLKTIWEEINDDGMPKKSYTWLHSKAELDFSKKTLLRKWLSNVDLWN